MGKKIACKDFKADLLFWTYGATNCCFLITCHCLDMTYPKRGQKKKQGIQIYNDVTNVCDSCYPTIITFYLNSTAMFSREAHLL